MWRSEQLVRGLVEENKVLTERLAGWLWLWLLRLRCLQAGGTGGKPWWLLGIRVGDWKVVDQRWLEVQFAGN